MLIVVARNLLEAYAQKQYQLALNHIFGTQTMPVRSPSTRSPTRPRVSSGSWRASPPSRRRSSRRSRRCARGWRMVGPERQSRCARRSSRSSDAGRRRRAGPGRRHWRTSLTTPRGRGVVRSRRRSTPRSRRCVTSWPTNTRRRRAGRPGHLERAGRGRGVSARDPDAHHRHDHPRRGASVRARGPEPHRGREGRDRPAAGYARPFRARGGAGRGSGQPHSIRGSRSSRWRPSRPCAPSRRLRATSGACRAADCEVKAVEAYREQEAPPAFYMPPSLDGSRQVSTTSTPTSPRRGTCTRSPPSPSTRRPRDTTSSSESRWS